MARMTEKDIVRFWSKVRKTPGCWLWTGGKRNGYGNFWLGTKKNGKDRYAHQIAYELAHGPIPDGLDVLHSCDNPACVNPEHLWTGSHLDNMQDMYAKGRRHACSGEKHPNAKLTWAQVRAIRREYVPRIVGCPVLAQKYGVDQAMIHRIIQGRAWRE